MTPEQKKQIDDMPYEEMLHSWRHDKLGTNPLLMSEAGDYYKKVMTEKRAKLTPTEFTRISKKIGW